MRDKFWCDVIKPRCHQKQHHATVTFEGIQISVQYQVNLQSLSSDIPMLDPRMFSYIFIF